jgi:HAD superfamily phosphoserine phosphatase-like hydrolase
MPNRGLLPVELSIMETIFLFDFDGTITRDELLPLIGKRVGLYSELNDLTNKTMQGEIPFDQSFLHRVNLLGRVDLAEIQEIILNAPCYEVLLGWIKSNRDNCLIVTGNLDLWIQPWLSTHGLKGFASEGIQQDKTYKVKKILRKETVLENFIGTKTVMIGDGANDSRIMELASVGIATELSHTVAPILWEHADYVVKDEKILCQILAQL